MGVAVKKEFLKLTRMHVASKLRDALSDAGVKEATVDPGDFRIGTLSIDGEVVGFELSEDIARSSWKYIPNGMWTLTVGGYRNNRRWKAGKSDFRYAEIAGFAISLAKYQIESRATSKRLDKERKVFQKTSEFKILESLGVNIPSSAVSHSSTDILAKLSPAAFRELADVCGVKLKG